MNAWTTKPPAATAFVLAFAFAALAFEFMFVVLVLVPAAVHPNEASAVSATITRKAVTEWVFLNSV